MQFLLSLLFIYFQQHILIYFHSWMYFLSPFTYLLESMLSLVVHNVPVRCSTNELATFAPPPNQSCQSYVGPYIAQAGGYVETQPNGDCGFCQYANGDEFAAGFNVKYQHLWRNYGFFWAYVLFNFAVVFFCSWLYLQGGRSLKGFLTGKTRKESKIRKENEKKIRDGREKV
jgi:ATP-binding cassette subfamily G (WHITE) protein 2 (SNQ2)